MRQQIPIKWIALTDLKADVQRGVKTGALKKALTKSGIVGKFAATQWGTKIARSAARKEMTDFARYQFFRKSYLCIVVKNSALL